MIGSDRIGSAATGSSRPRHDRGSSSLELAFCFPALLVLVFGAIQIGLVGWDGSVTLGAAEDGARVGAAQGSSAALGAERARDFLARAGVTDVQRVTPSENDDAVTITVVTAVRSVVPGLGPWTVTRSASEPRERLT